jgi:hypothetical protein
METLSIIIEFIEVTGRVLFPFFVILFSGAFIVGYKDYKRFKS